MARVVPFVPIEEPPSDAAQREFRQFVDLMQILVIAKPTLAAHMLRWMNDWLRDWV